MPTITQEQFSQQLIANNGVIDVKMTTALLGNYQQYELPGMQIITLEASKFNQIEFQTPPQTQLIIKNTKIGKFQAGEGGAVNELVIVDDSKVDQLTIIPSIGARIRNLKVIDSKVDRLELFGDFSVNDYLQSFVFTNSKSSLISLRGLVIAGDVTITGGNVALVELNDVEINGKLTLNGVKQVNIVNGKFADATIIR